MKYPKTVIITGANGQTAINLAKELQKQKVTLILLVHERRDRVDALANQNTHILPCDLKSYEQTDATITAFLKDKKLIPDALIHTAAIRSYDAKALYESEPETWKSVIVQNIDFAYNILRCVLPLMAKVEKGKVVLFGSNVTRTGLPYGSAYAAGKAALANLVRTVAWEMAPYNIQINMVSPAPVETNLEEDYRGEYLAFRKEYFEAYKKSHPSGKLVSINDITQTVLSLINFDNSSISGEEIYLTGGVL